MNVFADRGGNLSKVEVEPRNTGNPVPPGGEFKLAVCQAPITCIPARAVPRTGDVRSNSEGASAVYGLLPHVRRSWLAQMSEA